MAAVVSPELALIDPELRIAALRELPPIEPLDFLRVLTRPPVELTTRVFDRVAVDPQTADAVLRAHRLRAALVYVLFVAARTAVMSALFALSLIVVVALIQILG